MSETRIGYARCSTDKQDLAAQKATLLHLGVTADRIYTDHGLTGTNRERPGLAQALAAVRAGDTLVVPKLLLGSKADIAGADELRPVDPTGLKLIDANPVPVLREFVEGFLGIAPEVLLGGVCDDQAGKEIIRGGRYEAVNVGLLDHMAGGVELALNGRIPRSVRKGSHQVDPGVRITPAALLRPIGERHHGRVELLLDIVIGEEYANQTFKIVAFLALVGGSGAIIFQNFNKLHITSPLIPGLYHCV